MSQTDQQKALQIMEALGLPKGHYAVQTTSDGDLVSKVELRHPDLLTKAVSKVTDRWMNIYVTTAVWFQLYESTASGILWTLALPDPNNPKRRCCYPYLTYELLDITINAMFARTDVSPETLSVLIEGADEIDGIPVVTF